MMNDEYEKRAEDFIRVASRASGIVDDTPLSEIVLKIYDAISINPRPDEFKGDVAFKRHRQPRQRLRKSHT
ncbi:MAG: hypothetical protein L6V85_09825 [Clostridiales bacterium]|nr:MAG: hypothetical protein L6V85_09825 [Clostridiales bacterium]